MEKGNEMSELPKIAIVGYGAMGKEIEKAALERGFKISYIFDQNFPLKKGEKYDFDVAIDFTVPESVIKNIKILTGMGKNIVVGTTGWYDKLDKVKEIVKENKTGLVWGANFSMGMQMFFRIVERAASLVNEIDGYDVFMHEFHHKRKLDSPSGTAHSIANSLVELLKSKNEIVTGKIDGGIEPSQLHATSTRGGYIPGTHAVYLDSEADTLELTHRARNRSGFAIGSLTAAKLIHGKKGLYKFSDMLDDIWGAKP
jgi:4-hydroxy-tetrahydrodipicolinate reductase